MNDLSKSPFLDRGMLSIVRQILSRRIPTIITNDHKYVVAHKDEIIQLDQVFDRELVKVLEDCKNYIATADAVVFLLNAQRAGKANDAREALQVATEEKFTATRSQLRQVLKESKSVPMAWAIAMAGDFSEARHPAKDNLPQSSIDKSRFRDFK